MVPLTAQTPRVAPQSNANIVTVEPAPNSEGKVMLSEQLNMIKLTPVQDTPRTIVLDTDSTLDQNGDGNPSNDNAVNGTYFSSKGTPIVLWFTNPKREYTLTVAAKDAGGNIQTQTIVVSDVSSAQLANQRSQAQQGIQFEQLGEGRVSFEYKLSQAEQRVPTVIKWDFGDGKQSLLDMPTHVYTKEGNFTVSAKVYDIGKGEVIKESAKSVNITGLTKPEIIPDDEKDKSPSNFGALIMKIIKYGGIALLALLIGIGIVFGLSKILKRGSSLEEKLAKAEQKLAGKTEEEEKSDALEIKDDVEEAEVVEDKKEAKEEKQIKEEKEEKETTPPEPKPEPKPEPAAKLPASTSGPAPDWLQPSSAQGGLRPASQPSDPAPKPKAETQPKPPPIEDPERSRGAPSPTTPSVPAPTPEPKAPTPPQPTAPEAPAEETKPEASGPEGPVPDWLKGTNNNAKPAKEAPKNEPAPKPQAEPKQSSTQPQGSAPAWLTQANQKPQDKPQEKADDDKPVAFLKADLSAVDQSSVAKADSINAQKPQDKPKKNNHQNRNKNNKPNQNKSQKNNQSKPNQHHGKPNNPPQSQN